MKKQKSREKFLERREMWFVKRAKDISTMGEVKKYIDEEFDEDERKGAYALCADIFVMSYPFCYETLPDNLPKILEEKYGLGIPDYDLIGDKIKEIEERIVKQKTNSDKEEEERTRGDRGKSIKEIIKELEKEYGEEVPIEEVLNLAEEKGMERDKAEEIIDVMKRDGLLFSPGGGVVKFVR